MNIDKNKMASWCVVVLTAALILTFVLVAPANAGVSPADGRSIGDGTNGTSAIIGETNLSFVNATGAPIPSGKLKSTREGSDISNIRFPNVGNVFDSSEAATLVKGEYEVIGDNGRTTTVDFYSPLDIDVLGVTTNVRGEKFSWVTSGGNITFNATTYLHHINGSQPNNISYKLLDHRGARLHEVNGVSLGDISVNGIGKSSITINTAGLELGEYMLSIETDPDTNNGLDAEGPAPAVTFEVRSIGVTIEASPEKQIVTKEITFTVKTTPNTNVILNVTWGMPSKVWFNAGKGEGVTTGGYGSAVGTSDEKGTLTAVADFNATGSYEITATELIANTTNSIFVEIVPYTATVTKKLKFPPIYYIGETVEITAETDAGTSITIKIDDEVVKGGASPVTYNWRTTESTPGKHKIAIWVSPFSDTGTDPPDDSVTIILLRGGLSAKTSTEFVAQGDDFTIEGTVPGRDCVDILTIAPKGGGGKGLDSNDISTETDGNLSAPGLTHYTSGVTSEKFKKDKIKVSLDADTGTYLIAVLNYGRDKKWGTSGNDNLLEVISNDYATSLASKTTEQILAILKDKTINVAGSDDLFCIATIKVENGFVTLNKIEDVHLGKNIEVTGITNRKVGAYVIVTVEGLEDNAVKLKPKFATVGKDDKNLYNKFSVSFATEAAKIGKYEVTADDGDGHMDTTTVNIVPAAAPSVNVSSSTPTAAEIQGHGTNESANATLQMAMSTPTSTQTETKKTPGFETIFTITVVFAVARLLRSVRHRQRKSES